MEEAASVAAPHVPAKASVDQFEARSAKLRGVISVRRPPVDPSHTRGGPKLPGPRVTPHSLAAASNRLSRAVACVKMDDPIWVTLARCPHDAVVKLRYL